MNDRELLEQVEVVGYLYAVCDDLLLDHQKPNLPHEPLMTVAQHKRILADIEANRDALLLVMQVESALKAQTGSAKVGDFKSGD